MYEHELERLVENSLIVAQEVCRRRQVRLSERAERLLYLMVDAWIREPPRPGERFSQEFRTPDEWVQLGQNILDNALGDARIAREMTTIENVTFPTLLHAVAEAGYRQLMSIGFKG
jgi:hypothetical protein